MSDVRRQLEAICGEMVDAEQQFLAVRSDIPEGRRESAANLLHYLALRRHDLRNLQTQLASLGLSSLGRAEAQALANVQAVVDVLHQLDGCERKPDATSHPRGSKDGSTRLELNTRALFGPPPRARDVRIMVTMPSEAASDPRLIRNLLASGMDCMRINGAHDDADAWARMLRHLSHAQEETGKTCRVLMDLAGPRLRTGPIEPGPPVVRWQPQRDVYGRVVKPARIWLTASGAPQPAPGPASVVFPVAASWLSELQTGDRLSLIDARDKKRLLVVTARVDGGVWTESEQTGYVMPGTRLRRKSRNRGERDTEVADVPPTEQFILLKPGDTLILTRGAEPGRPAVVNGDGRVLAPATIGVTLQEVFDDVQPGQSIWFDDGRIGGTIRTTSGDRVEVTISQAKSDGSKLSDEKGINLPDTDLHLPSLTRKDLDDLRFMGAHADIIGYSFVRTAADVETLQAHLATALRHDLGLILKIETRRAFEQLPSLLLAAMRSAASGVMIARGDLAVECGYERLAEVQEEILWMAEASHTPVIWATQVLETLAKDGTPSRAEITDAAMSERAECVMLNKGPYVVDAVRALDDILTRMQAHQRKKSAMLRHLGIADRFLKTP